MSEMGGRMTPEWGTDRVSLGSWPTPLEPAPRLARELGFEPGAFSLKRDDLTGLGGGGNKVRKLEYLCAGAIVRRATMLITSGRIQSNHARLTASAAARLGLDCVLVLAGEPPPKLSGNLTLESILEARIVWAGPADDAELEAKVNEVASEEAASGAVVEVIPLGGSSALGARGYMECGRELEAQVPGLRHVVVALGTGGTMAGLVATLGAERVLGVDVGATADAPARVAKLVGELRAGSVDARSLRIRSDQVGEGYGLLTPAASRAMSAAARLEGVFLDPVYTAKALSGLAAAMADGSISPDDPTVFIHTGGLPGLFGHPALTGSEALHFPAAQS
jgi:L-cysteate sulfo-lyase